MIEATARPPRFDPIKVDRERPKRCSTADDMVTEIQIAWPLKERERSAGETGQGRDHEPGSIRSDPTEPSQIGNRRIRNGNGVQHPVRPLEVLNHSLPEQF